MSFFKEAGEVRIQPLCLALLFAHHLRFAAALLSYGVRLTLHAMPHAAPGSFASPVAEHALCFPAAVTNVFSACLFSLALVSAPWPTSLFEPQRSSCGLQLTLHVRLCSTDSLGPQTPWPSLWPLPSVPFEQPRCVHVQPLTWFSVLVEHL